jgi:hypothetical protein
VIVHPQRVVEGWVALGRAIASVAAVVDVHVDRWRHEVRERPPAEGVEDHLVVEPVGIAGLAPSVEPARQIAVRPQDLLRHQSGGIGHARKAGHVLRRGTIVGHQVEPDDEISRGTLDRSLLRIAAELAVDLEERGGPHFPPLVRIHLTPRGSIEAGGDTARALVARGLAPEAPEAAGRLRVLVRMVVVDGGEEVGEALGNAAARGAGGRARERFILESMAELVEHDGGVGGVRGVGGLAFTEDDLGGGSDGLVVAVVTLRIHRHHEVRQAAQPENALDVVLEAVDVVVRHHIEEFSAGRAEHEAGSGPHGLGERGVVTLAHGHVQPVQAVLLGRFGLLEA